MTADCSRALIGVTELAEALRTGTDLVVLDVRWQVGTPSQYPEYLAGHIPGARWCDLDLDLADPAGPGGRHPLPDPARLQQAVRRWGIGRASRVVAYDADIGVAAARAWWVLRWAGLEQVQVLDGGLAAWLAAGQPVQATEPEPSPGDAVIRPGSLPALTAEQALAAGGRGRLVDVRAAERFRGEQEPIDPVAGHVPGAINLPTTGNVDDAGRFLPPAELRRRFERLAAGDGPDEPVGVYCGSGVTAAHTVLAMHEAGLPAVLYPGSWSEWITDPARPVATGE
ncbi:MAG TPA: sulfurtransferase [Jatrophihabitans sp.]|nr:sulfurtransferase [Jatrophihabitans sp.]